MTKTTLTGLAMVAACLFSGVAMAENTVAAPANDAQDRKSLFDKVDSIRADNALLAIQIENAKLKKQLADWQAGRDPSGPASQQPTVFGTSQPMPPAGAGSSSSGVGLPRGAMVELVTSANNGAPTALVQLPSGGRILAKVGSKLPGVGTVESVSIRAVMVNDGKHSYALPFDGGDDQASAGATDYGCYRFDRWPSMGAWNGMVKLYDRA
ncbi:type IV pilus biogenesis protein PilP [Paraburkholderia largidicola]|uniref:Type IV pilus biogenesis protein PilP n=1 Tax=Paraburkholderia largidicola TaxID=3014751 RepID=A0A7I8C2Y8_9BURK|nr:type IV pilus biogenesis protein PilP [Paraburkholderia sp. PGU16]BCF95427.1 hypothetical protein PPGU16_84940 [Paraburkholderia sp. PGU16]